MYLWALGLNLAQEEQGSALKMLDQMVLLIYIENLGVLTFFFFKFAGEADEWNKLSRRRNDLSSVIQPGDELLSVDNKDMTKMGFAAAMVSLI